MNFGLIAELKFQQKAIEHGHQVSRPIDPNSKYDFIVDIKTRVIRVQVKTRVIHLSKRKYRVSTAQYTLGDFDFWAVHTAPSGDWYLIPFISIKGIEINPKTGNQEKWRENWTFAST